MGIRRCGKVHDDETSGCGSNHDRRTLITSSSFAVTVRKQREQSSKRIVIHMSQGCWGKISSLAGTQTLGLFTIRANAIEKPFTHLLSLIMSELNVHSNDLETRPRISKLIDIKCTEDWQCNAVTVFGIKSKP